MLIGVTKVKFFKKLSKYKVANKFLRVAIAGMLLFTMLIPTAVSYQQAMTSTSENTYAIGDGVSATLNVATQVSNSQNLIYPGEYIQMKPVITNTGKSSIWVILAVKIPAANNPYTASVMVGDLWSRDIKDAYYPAFYSVRNAEDMYGLDYPELLTTGNRYFDNYNYDETDNIYNWQQDCNDGWVALTTNSTDSSGNTTQTDTTCFDYVKEDNGYYIYYYGYKTTLGSGAQPTNAPFDGMVAATFQELVYTIFDAGAESVAYYDCKEMNTNSSVEMRLFAIQSEGLDSVQDAWAKNKDKLSLFGSTSIVNVTTQTEYTKGRNDVVFTVTKDVQQIKVTNETSGKSEVFDMSSTTNVTVGDVDANGLRKVTLKVNFDSTGIYKAEVSANTDGTFTNTVIMGYSTVK